jgi:hypothetical protein
MLPSLETTVRLRGSLQGHDASRLSVQTLSQCISGAQTLPILVKFGSLQLATCSKFSVLFSKFTVLHPVFDLSHRGQVPGNVSLIFTVPTAVFGHLF